MVNNISVHTKEVCVCGQEHEIVYNMKEGGFTVGYAPVKFDFSESFVAHTEPERKLEFSGVCGLVELNGMKWEKGSGVVCQKCGVNLVYGLIADAPKEQEQQ